MGRTRERFFKLPDPKLEVTKVYKIDEYTIIKKLNNGVEIVEEDYTQELESQPHLCTPQKVMRTLHPGGRQDCNLLMSRLGAKSKHKE